MQHMHYIFKFINMQFYPTYALKCYICILCSNKGIRDCLVPVTPCLAGKFKLLKNKGKLLPKVRVWMCFYS